VSFASIARPDSPRSEGEITGGVTVGSESSREELEEHLTLRAKREEVLVRAGCR
jgi:hypothetical protein